EAELRAEVLIGVHKVDMGAEHATGTVHPDVALDTRDLAAAAGGLGLGADQFHVGHPVLGELELAIDAGHAIEAFVQLAGDEGATEAVLLAEVLVAADHAYVGLLALERIAVQAIEAGCLIVHQHGTKAEVALAARQAQTAFGVDDAAGEQKNRVGGEEVGVLHEEGAALGVLYFKALVHGHLRFVRLDLREVRVQGHVQHPGVVEDELGVDAHVVFGLALQAGPADSTLVDGLHIAGKDEGNDLVVVAGLHAADAGHQRGLVEAAIDAVGVGRPVTVLTQTRNVAAHLQAPQLFLGFGQAQSAQWHGDAHHVTLVGQLTLTVPYGFPGGIESGAVGETFGPAGVPLHAQGCDPKGVGSTLVVEGIDDELNTVV